MTLKLEQQSIIINQMKYYKKVTSSPKKYIVLESPLLWPLKKAEKTWHKSLNNFWKHEAESISQEYKLKNTNPNKASLNQGGTQQTKKEN